MVVGNGLVAKRFITYSDDSKFLIFASGVSNSKNTNSADYTREFELLKQVAAENKEKVFIYFSTCSINDPAEIGSDYVIHKKNIEKFICTTITNYLIFRVSNLVGWSSNIHTILNFITHNIQEQIHFDLWLNATRNLIDVDDFFVIADYIIQKGLFLNQIVNVANPINYSVQEIVFTTEKHFKKKANCTIVTKGGSFNIDISAVVPLFEQLNLQFDKDYLKNLLLKYY